MARHYVDGRGLVDDVICNRVSVCPYAKMINKCSHSFPHLPILMDDCITPGECAMTDEKCFCVKFEN